MSLNKVILIGRLGRDPEVRYMPNGEAVCNFSVATSETWNDRNGQRVERTDGTTSPCTAASPKSPDNT